MIYKMAAWFPYFHNNNLKIAIYFLQSLAISEDTFEIC